MTFFDNPISKGKAGKETIQYYEKTYKEKFIVYSTRYNYLIPAYIVELGPEKILCGRNPGLF
ncbi:MAG TPA: hypothetical protein DDY49_03445 [Paenibacillaceae bacterium]|nr:hypothetical protein [Paenibacillaceae bacterium]